MPMNGCSYKESLKLLNNENWAKLSVEKKVEVLQAVEREMAIREKRFPCQVTAESIKSDNGVCLGLYSPSSKDIKINADQLSRDSKYGNDYSTHLDTVLHEGRHAYQDQVVNGYVRHEDSKKVMAWRENMKDGNYIRYEQNPRAYFNQPIEKDAREFAAKTTLKVEEEKVQLQREKLTNQYENHKITNSSLEEKRQRYLENIKRENETNKFKEHSNGKDKSENLNRGESNSKNNGMKR